MLELDSEGVYQPKTRETRAAYETLLSIVRGQFGDQPADVLRGAADEIMAVLKNDRLKVASLHSVVMACKDMILTRCTGSTGYVLQSSWQVCPHR